MQHTLGIGPGNSGVLVQPLIAAQREWLMSFLLMGGRGLHMGLCSHWTASRAQLEENWGLPIEWTSIELLGYWGQSQSGSHRGKGLRAYQLAGSHQAAQAPSSPP